MSVCVRACSSKLKTRGPCAHAEFAYMGGWAPPKSTLTGEPLANAALLKSRAAGRQARLGLRRGAAAAAADCGEPPEAERLVCGGRYRGGPVGAHGEMQDAAAVSGELGDGQQRRPAPDADRVLTVAVARNELFFGGAPLQARDLRASV